ncbi:MAG: hypothetical protein KKF62_07085 [Bacteroidetes bacterium]|nr:hypothetical protein [Bacteroidota bacterium]MBU1114531.1 hypothetical protein [Bacteroidota bacterium]MBU1799924.1 hypothetical protein [Bacteroidota bacterium]
MINKIFFILLFFVLGSIEIFSQEFKTQNFFFNNFSWTSEKNSPLIFGTSNKLIYLRKLNNHPVFASSKTYTDKPLNIYSEDNVNHHPLVFAKLRFFGIDNLEKRDETNTSFEESESSFWDNEIVYFVVGAVAATTLYIVWQNSDSKNPPQKTFGLPPKPEGSYAL